MSEKPVTACLIIIGNEILSGRTVDANLSYLAKALGAIGIRLAEARVIPDDEGEIVDAVNACRVKHDYVFTTGGIGPTHDDITAAAIAKAFDLPFGRNAEAEALLLAFYPPEKVNEARMSMADMPDGAELIGNPVSTAPGFRIENVHVLAGVPKIMQVILDTILPNLKGGAVVLSRSITVFMPEGEIAMHLKTLQDEHPELDIGSYPFFGTAGPGSTIVCRGTDQNRVDQAANTLLALAPEIGVKMIDGAART
ncbi:MAG: molybdopterin-binding protein [Alphaproteobacteria bacterium]|nr:molybdopterin-binding protein [Alphaproteobacteria bacterium]